MKNISLIVWITQLGLSVAVPPAGLILLALWLEVRFGWGNWVLWVAIVLGLICAVDGLCTSLKTMSRIAKGEKEQSPPPVSFNDHN